MTPSGPAGVALDGAAGLPLLVLGHGAGGGVEAPDLLAARDAALAAGWACARVEQPYRVRGSRAPAPAAQLDAAWTAVLDDLRDGRPMLVAGGRSSGARVACRTAVAGRVAAVLCLAFPLVPPGRTADRGPELALPPVPRLVVQGARDAFGVPSPGPGVAVHVVAGADHGFRTRRADGRAPGEVEQEVRDVVGGWLAGLAQTLT